MRTIIVGFPRSGTGSMSNKYDVGHEYINENGTSDWRIAFHYKKQKDDYLIHVIRNPIDSISSNIFTMGYNSLTKIKQDANIENKSLLSTVVEGFIKWTKQIELLHPDKVIKIEDEEIISNTRPHPTLKWSDLKCLPIELQKQLCELTKKYGYSTNN